MTASDDKPFRLDDFLPFLQTLNRSGIQGLLIGGLAVSAWAEALLSESERAAYDLPIYSKDLDLRGQKAASMFLAKDLELAGALVTGVVTATRKNAPHMGKVHAVSLQWQGYHTSIEALERLPGLDSSLEDPPNGTGIQTEAGYSLLDPCSLFICKLHAANTRPPGGASNDEKHLAILAKVIPRFLSKIRSASLPDYSGKEDCERLLKLLEASISRAHPFVIPLSQEEIRTLMVELNSHLITL